MIRWTAIVAAGLMALGCATTAPSSAEKAQEARAAAAAANGALDAQQGAAQTPRAGQAQQGAVQKQPQAKKSGDSATPAWLETFPVEEGYFTGIGGAPDTDVPATDIDAARANARKALATEVQTQIQSTTSAQSRDNSAGNAESSLTVLINEKVNLKLDGVELVDSFHSKELGYWFYYRLSRSALDPGPAIARGVTELVAKLPRPLSLRWGSVTYADTGLGSAFSQYLEDQVLLALRSEKDVTIAAQAPATQGGGASGTAASGGTTKGAAASTAAASGLVLTGTFFDSSAKGIPVFLRLTDASSGSIVANCTFAVAEAGLPASLAILPPNHATAITTKETIGTVLASRPDAMASPDAFSVRLWTDRGDGATYLDGEDLVVSFSATRDCYIKMYYIDVNGHATLILPNQYSRVSFFEGGRTYRIPAANDPFRFHLHEPFGVEFVKVIASTLPFGETETPFTDLGRVTKGTMTRGLTAEPKQTAMAEALISYTILGRQ